MASTSQWIKLFFCGDVMTGRGIDQILPKPSSPQIYEPSAHSSIEYLNLAQKKNGIIPHPVKFEYIWGDALGILEQMQPDLRIINLETSVTTSEGFLPKGINYRMHPENVPILNAARIDACTLANNHVLDWGQPGLEETVRSVRSAGVKTVGAGANEREAMEPAIFELPDDRRVLLFGMGDYSSGIPSSWSATSTRSGVNLLPNLSEKTVNRIAAQISEKKRQSRDIVVVSLHWGSNFDFTVERSHQRFARALIDKAGVDVIHGHSSHHVKGIEVYKNKLILYGCGDFINDYEGISGEEFYRGDLSLMYYPIIDANTGDLVKLQMAPTAMRQFAIHKAKRTEIDWLKNTLNHEGMQFNTSVIVSDGMLELQSKAVPDTSREGSMELS